ncbi:DUF692 domain-containing protein [Streptomyces sp. NBC_00690]|uniref:DUF692 domain-containing protein n=1 Tax=Streptomyces sp. NBC_00690 TaxID=2975808 RepID=UPI002E2E102B|nr:DUF692 family multinuclear iron-containing protein [Streptomyces sp. NBC_00690]
MALGMGIGWRPEIARTVEELSGLDWVEVVAENICPCHLPDSLSRLLARGLTVVPHGVSLGLGDADRPSEQRLKDLAERATALGAPLVTEHIAFVRAGGKLTASPQLEAGHLLPVPRTWDALKVLVENVRIAQDSLPVPLALENIAALISWPDEELTEGQFLAELVERTGVGLLIDVANLHTNHVNRGEDPAKALAELPVEAIAYVHVAGGEERDGVWHDTHAHPVTEPVLEVLRELASRVSPPGVLLERDDDFPPSDQVHGALAGELAAIREAVGGAVQAPPATRPASATATDREADASPGSPGSADPSARDRLGICQTALLASLVAGGPAPEGFDHQRLRVQRRALAAKRASVVARIAPELPEILGPGYRPAFLAYAKGRPMGSGYRKDALSFAEHLLISGRPANARARRQLTRWWEDRIATRPPGRAARIARAARMRLLRR